MSRKHESKVIYDRPLFQSHPNNDLEVFAVLSEDGARSEEGARTCLGLITESDVRTQLAAWDEHVLRLKKHEAKPPAFDLMVNGHTLRLHTKHAEDWTQLRAILNRD